MNENATIATEVKNRIDEVNKRILKLDPKDEMERYDIVEELQKIATLVTDTFGSAQ